MRLSYNLKCETRRIAWQMSAPHPPNELLVLLVQLSQGVLIHHLLQAVHLIGRELLRWNGHLRHLVGKLANLVEGGVADGLAFVEDREGWSRNVYLQANTFTGSCIEDGRTGHGW